MPIFKKVGFDFETIASKGAFQALYLAKNIILKV